MFKRLFAALALFAVTVWAIALPTVEAVQAEVNKGNLAQAQSMMREVVTARPDSARAHYVYAEILARNGQLDQAASEAREARRLDPRLSFASDPERFNAFEKALGERRAATLDRLGPNSGTAAPAQRTAPAQTASPGLPSWVWIVGIAAVAWLAWRTMRRRAASAAAMSAGGPAYGAGPARFDNATGTNMPMNPGAMGAGMPGRSGMLGAGLGAAGGFAAGMLAEKMLHGHQDHGSNVDAGSAAAGGGLVPGVFDDGRDLSAGASFSDQPVDFGTGNDWGGDVGGDVGDAGGGDSGDGGW